MNLEIERGPSIILDLDGTACDNAHRVHHAQNGEWDLFNSKCDEDMPHADVLTLVKAFQHWPTGPAMIAVTGRNAKHRNVTLNWLARHNIYVDHLLMRADGDYRHDYEVKLDLIERFFETKEEVLKNVLFALDDRTRVVEAFRNYGIRTWQVREGAY